MRIQYISDLHLEKALCVPLVRKAPTLFVAGDLGWPRQAEFRNALREMGSKWDRVFYAPGNHEYDVARCADEMAEIDEEIDEMAAECGNVHVLRAGRSFQVGNYDVIGSTLWSFTMGRSWRQVERNSRFLNEVQDLHMRITQARRPLIVLTHYAPSFQVSPYLGWASNSDFLLRDPVKVWICGHTHVVRDVRLHGVRLLINTGKKIRCANLEGPVEVP